MIVVGIIAGSLALAACATDPCVNTLSYRQARAEQPPQVPQGLKPITPDPAFQIPPGETAANGPATLKQCIILPPTIVKPGEQPAPASGG